jgi:hypothetical protein
MNNEAVNMITLPVAKSDVDRAGALAESLQCSRAAVLRQAIRNGLPLVAVPPKVTK